MGTKTLNDIHNDMKQLITAITSFEQNEDGFQICERFCMTSIKHHRFLSVNSNSTKEAIKALITKLSIHGKYDVATKFEEYVNIFLSSFDFEQHPQYDLQWCLLTFLLELSKETSKFNLECLKLTRGECTFNATGENDSEATEEIDWSQYLKEGQENFFDDYKSDTESEWSDDDKDVTDISTQLQISTNLKDSDKRMCISVTAKTESNTLSVALTEDLKSRNWLLSNIQNTWWNELEWWKYPVKSQFCDANLCEIWHKATEPEYNNFGTISEYLVCRELLWMFYAPTRMVVFQQNGDTDFFIRPNICIPSLTTVAFNSILSPLCKYFSMIREIERFGEEIYIKGNGLCKKPPFTYEAYNAVLRQHLMKFKNEIIDIEKRFMKQDESLTFLSLSILLKKRLYNINILYEIHQKVVCDWKVHPNWICASKLLSSLYFELQKSHNRRRSNICASLYLSSLSVYLNIIDTWLSEGRFEDWREEFIIVRFLNDTSLENNGQYKAFSLRPLNVMCLADPIMQFLIKKMQRMGQSIELLVSLDRITDIWKINSENEIKMSLTDEFYSKLKMEVSKYSTHELQEKKEEDSSLQENVETSDKCDEDVERAIIQQLNEFNNLFLLKALEDYIPSELLQNNTIDICCTKNKNVKTDPDHLFERLEKISDYILPFRKILQTILAEILVSRYNSASKLVKNIMSEEYKLESHLTLMRSVYMMEAGHIMSKFHQKLFQEIESNQMWSNSYYLSCILEEVLSQKWPDSSSRWSVTVRSTHTNQVLTAIDNITLHYAVGWPINIVLNEETFIKYNEIFRFQLRLKYALWTLNNLRFCDLEGSKSMNVVKNKLEQYYIRRIESLRFCLLHAITSIHTYLSGQVLQNLSIVLEKSLMKAECLDIIISVHNEYLQKVYEHCLLTPEYDDLMATVNNLIKMCNNVRARWNYKNLMYASGDLDLLENSYTKYHTYLALALHNAVQNKDANYYELMLRYQTNSRNVNMGDDETICSYSNLNRSFLIEVAFQNLPPSGLPIPIPKVIHKTDWCRNSSNSEYPLPNEITLSEYEQTFSYIRWYQLEESVVTFSISPYILRREMKDIIDGINNI